jgi:predicted nucleic acid-binding protein
MNAVDTNVLIYSIDKRDPVKQAKAQQLFQHLLTGSQQPFLLWQVHQRAHQSTQALEGSGATYPGTFDQHVLIFRSHFKLVLPTDAVIDHALDLAKRHSLSHWDSMILGACKEAGITTLYTDDMGAPITIDGIQLVNPF